MQSGVVGRPIGMNIVEASNVGACPQRNEGRTRHAMPPAAYTTKERRSEASGGVGPNVESPLNGDVLSTRTHPPHKHIAAQVPMGGVWLSKGVEGGELDCDSIEY